MTVFVNKALLSSKEVDLDAPLFVTWYQCIVSTVICFTLSSLSKIFPHHIKFPEGTPLDTATMWKVGCFSNVRRGDYNVINFISQILPLSILFTAMISFNNLCLKFVGVSFYYVGRSLTTVFNVILTYLVLGENKTVRRGFCVCAQNKLALEIIKILCLISFPILR